MLLSMVHEDDVRSYWCWIITKEYTVDLIIISIAYCTGQSKYMTCFSCFQIQLNKNIELLQSDVKYFIVALLLQRVWYLSIQVLANSATIYIF